jgi:hypothetical protein
MRERRIERRENARIAYKEARVGFRRVRALERAVERGVSKHEVLSR